MERQIPRNPSRPEIRLHCLDMAVRAAQLTGRAENMTVLADQYFAWVMQGQPREEPPPTAFEAGPNPERTEPIGGANKEPSPLAASGPENAPPSLRQSKPKP